MSRESEAVSHLALDWLREVLHTEFSGPVTLPPAAHSPGAAAAGPDRGSPAVHGDPFEVGLRYSRGETGVARWYRDWHRAWRRFQLSDQLHRFAERLLSAEHPDDVYRALSEHAVRVVGGFTCLLFPPQEAMPLRPLPNPLLALDSGRLTISIPLAQPGTIRREEALTDGPFANLAPLFTEARAVSLAYAPFGDGGVILLLERRQERTFDAGDREMLRVLAELAGATLARVRLTDRTETLAGADDGAGLLGESLLIDVLDHAMTLAREGEPLTLVAARLDGLDRISASDGSSAARRVTVSAAAALRELAGTLGIVLRRGEDGFYLVLPRLNREQAVGLVERVERQLPAGIRLLLGVAEHSIDADSPTTLVSAADHAVDREDRTEGRPAGAGTCIAPGPTRLTAACAAHVAHTPLPRRAP